MTCSIDGCGKTIKFKAEQLCQMHYFRRRRLGGFELPHRDSRPQHVNPKGYVARFEPDHPLAMTNGYVYVHRAMVWERYGETLPACEICRAATDWASCHIDHRNEKTDDNRIDNLRPLCSGCNTTRTPRSTTPRFEWLGQMLTVTELARLPGVEVSRSQVAERLRAGHGLQDALFALNQTHPKAAK